MSNKHGSLSDQSRKRLQDGELILKELEDDEIVHNLPTPGFSPQMPVVKSPNAGCVTTNTATTHECLKQVLAFVRPGVGL